MVDANDPPTSVVRALASRRIATCVVSSLYSDQPLARVSRKTVLEPADLISLLLRRLASGRSMVVTAVSIGRVGHVIYLVSAELDRREFTFVDPWPGRSLLCAENNSVGTSARPSGDGHDLWVVSADDLAPALVAVIVPSEEWEVPDASLEIRPAPLIPTSEDIDAFDRAMRVVQQGVANGAEGSAATITEQHVRVLRAASGLVGDRNDLHRYGVALLWHHSEPFSAAAAATAAREFANALRSRAQTDLAIHWWRQAAMMRDRDAATALAGALAERGMALESEYGERRAEEIALEAIPESWRPWTSSELLASHWAAPQAVLQWRQFPGMDSERRAQRAFEVGYTRHSEGDGAGALAAFTEIAELEDPFVSAKAAVLLGRLLEDGGDFGRAAEMYVLAA